MDRHAVRVVIKLGTLYEASGQLHAQVSLPPGTQPSYPLDKRLGGL